MKVYMIVVLAAFAWCAHADLGTESTNLSSSPLLAGSGSAAMGMNGIYENGIYEITAGVQVEAIRLYLNEELQPLGSDEVVQLFAGEFVSLQFDADEVTLHTLPLIALDGPPDVVKIVLSRDEVSRMGLKFAGPGNEHDLQPAYAQGVSEIAGRMVLRRGGRVIARG